MVHNRLLTFLYDVVAVMFGEHSQPVVRDIVVQPEAFSHGFSQSSCQQGVLVLKEFKNAEEPFYST